MPQTGLSGVLPSGGRKAYRDGNIMAALCDEGPMALRSDLDRYMQEQELLFADMDRAAAVDAIVEKLTAAMRQMDERDPDALADIARQWTFDFVRHQNGATFDLASDLSTSVANRIRNARLWTLASRI